MSLLSLFIKLNSGPGGCGLNLWSTANNAVFDVQSSTDNTLPNGSIKKLTDTTAVMVWRQNTSLYAVIVTLSGNDITFGAVATVGSVYSTESGIMTDGLDRLSDTSFIVTWINSSPSVGRAVVGTISGTTISFGTTLAFHGTSIYINNVGVLALSSTKAIVGFRVTSAGNITARILTISGTTITAGSAVVIHSSGGYNTFFSKISESYVLFTHSFSNAGNNGAKILYISGTSITVYTNYQITTEAIDYPCHVLLDSSTAIFLYKNITDNTVVARLIFISGTTITFSSEQVIYSGDNTERLGCCLIGTDTALFLYTKSDSPTTQNSVVLKRVNNSLEILSNDVPMIDPSISTSQNTGGKCTMLSAGIFLMVYFNIRGGTKYISVVKATIDVSQCF